MIMDEELLTYVLDRLHKAETAIVETEHRIGDGPSNDHAHRSLARAQKAVTSVLKRLDPNFEADDDNEVEDD